MSIIVPEPGVDLLSINNLPSVVYVTCYTDITDNFSYELCQSAMDTFVDPIGDKKPAEAKTIIDPPIVVKDPGVDLLSINNLPSVVYVACYTDITDNFSYELCQSATDTFVDPIGDKKPIVVEPTEAR